MSLVTTSHLIRSQYVVERVNMLTKCHKLTDPKSVDPKSCIVKLETSGAHTICMISVAWKNLVSSLPRSVTTYAFYIVSNK